MSEGDRLVAIRKRLEAATKGPWTVSGDEAVVVDERDRDKPPGTPVRVGLVAQSDFDATFIAHAPDDLAFLLGRVEELDAVLADSPVVTGEPPQRVIAKAHARISSLEAEVARLREGLRKYGEHKEGCPEVDREESRFLSVCTCGLDSLLSGSGEGG